MQAESLGKIETEIITLFIIERISSVENRYIISKTLQLCKFIITLYLNIT